MNNLHDKIMAIQVPESIIGDAATSRLWRAGHKAARHAAAERRHFKSTCLKMLDQTVSEFCHLNNIERSPEDGAKYQYLTEQRKLLRV